MGRSQRLAQRLHPISEAGSKDTGVDPIENPLKRIMRWNAIAQTQKPAKPSGTLLCKNLDVLPGVTIGDDSTNRDDNDVQETMAAPPTHTRVLEQGKVFLDRHSAGSSHRFLH